MVTIPNNGRQVTRDDPIRERLLTAIANCKARGEVYPRRTVDDYYAQPFVWFGRAAYHAETLEHLVLTRAAKRRPITLPDHFILDGEQRLPGESQEQYRKYCIYRDLGTERTLGQLARRLGFKEYGATNNRKVQGVSALSAMAARWRWYERVMAFDGQMAVEVQRALAKVQEDQMREHIQRRQAYLENEHEFIDSTVKRIKQMLAFPVDRQRVVTETYPDGREKTVTIVEPAKWTYASLAQIQAEVTKLARLHFGLSTSNASQKIEAQITDATPQQERPMSAEDQEMHEFAAARAETAYFDALEAWKRDHSQPLHLALVQ